MSKVKNPARKCRICGGKCEKQMRYCPSCAREVKEIRERRRGNYFQTAPSGGERAKLREAAANIAEYARSAQCHTEDAHVLGYLNQIEGWANAALAEPVKNCEVGTPEEQMKRQHDTMCNTTKACPDSDWSCRKCFAEWAQMPYEEGVADGAAT